MILSGPINSVYHGLRFDVNVQSRNECSNVSLPWMCRRTSINFADWLKVTCSCIWETLIGCLTLTVYPNFEKITKEWGRMKYFIYQPGFMIIHVVWNCVPLKPHALLSCRNLLALLLLIVNFNCQIIFSELIDIKSQLYVLNIVPDTQKFGGSFVLAGPRYYSAFVE
jgi:hypothetical protein